MDRITNSLIKITEKIYIIGSIHIAQESADYVKKMITKIKPKCVMVELDEERYFRLTQEKDSKHQKEESESQIQENLAYSSYNEKFFSSLQFFQEKLGHVMGINPGEEMLTALRTVQELNIPYLLIDRPMSKTLQRFQQYQKHIKKEQIELVKELESEDFQPTKENLTEIMNEFEDPDIIKDLIRSFKKSFPELAKILLQERDEYMVNQIYQYTQKNPENKILIIVGAAHIMSITRMIKKK